MFDRVDAEGACEGLCAYSRALSARGLRLGSDWAAVVGMLESMFSLWQYLSRQNVDVTALAWLGNLALDTSSGRFGKANRLRCREAGVVLRVTPFGEAAGDARGSGRW